MSTGSDLSDYYENGPLGHRYVIHLKSKDEICLHALTLLQTDLVPCYMPVHLSEDETQLLIDLSGCIPFSEIKGKEKAYVKRHYRDLLSSFLSSLIRSLDYALDPYGICYLEDQLFFDRKRQRLVCIYLPLSSRLKGAPLLSSIDENGLDELLHEPYEKKWISTKAMEKLYGYFRRDDEVSSLRYIDKGLWEDSRTLPSWLRILCLLWGIILFLYVFVSPWLEASFPASRLSGLSGILFFICTAVLFSALFVNIKRSSKDSRKMTEEKVIRRKRKNAQMLFPSFDMSEQNYAQSFELHSDPVQLIRIDHLSGNHSGHPRLTIWTNACTVGSDSDCCDIPIDHPSVALLHAQFGHDDYGFFIEPLQESKPTFRNRQRIRPNIVTYLEEGDIVGIGDLEYKTHFIHD